MRLYLSSFLLGNRPDELLALLGAGRKTALIGNAFDYESAERRKALMTDEIKRLSAAGLVPTEIDLRNYFDKSGELEERLRSFDLVWVRGGDPYFLRRAFRKSGADTIVIGLLRSDEIAYGGYSAGIIIATPSLAGISTYSIAESEVIREGLNLVPYCLVPHYRSAHPGAPFAEQMTAYLMDQHIPFIALRDGEALVKDSKGERIVG